MRYIIVFSLIVLVFSSCKNRNTDPSDSEITFTLDFQDRKQQISAIGASDAWSCQFVGKNWPVAKREQIGRLLFSIENDKEGNPLGAGLSGWRFNIGAGSAEQGNNSEIEDEWRRTEGFLNQDGTYNWDKQQGQRWFLKTAGNYGVECITAFLNSPPVNFTRNGKAWSPGGSSANLKPENYVSNAKFVSKVIKTLQEEDSVVFDYLSPVNESQWDWNEKGQEGSPFLNSEIASLTREISKEFLSDGISLKIEISDAGHLVYLCSPYDRPGREDQAKDFFDPSSANYIGNLSNVALKLSGHSYFSTFPLDTVLINLRRNLTETFKKINPNLEFWQTEYCILDNNDEITGNGRDLGINPALYMARMIHFDFVLANSCSWYWWLAVSPYDFKDGLIYIDKDKSDGNIYESKLLWTLGNYSRFVRPGMYRYNVSRTDEMTDEVAAKNLMVSGYGTEDKSKAVFVIINYSQNSTYSVALKSTSSRKVENMKVYTTSSGENSNLRLSIPEDYKDILAIAPRSVVTVVLEYL